MGLSDRLVRSGLVALGALLLLGSILGSPPVLGWLVAVDGQIDNPSLVIAFWVLAAVSFTGGCLACWLAARVPHARRMAAAVWSGRWRLLALAVLVACLVGVGLGTLTFYRNHVDLLSRLDPQHPVYAQVMQAKERGGTEEAERTLAAYLAKRAPVATLPPYQRWVSTDEKSNLLATRLVEEGDVGKACGGPSFLWRPGQPLLWTGPTPENVRFFLHRQWFLFDLLQAPVDGSPQVRIEWAAALAREWRRGNRVWPNFDPYAWNDEVVANRIMGQVILMETWRRIGVVPIEDEIAFLKSLCQHADFLMDSKKYNFRTNHGLMQNAALLYLAIHYPELAAAPLWKETAVERTSRHMREHVDSDGVFLEISPAYHLFATSVFLWFHGACSEAGINLGPAYEFRLRKMLTFCRDILNPDGSLPMIGDTSLTVAAWPSCPWAALPRWSETEALKSALSGAERPPNRSGAFLWPESGYFVLRTPAPAWTQEQAMMLTLRAGPGSHAHFQPDALSITFFAQGRPLLVGPGYPDYFTPGRAEKIATMSQNTVSVDNKSQRKGDARMTFADFRPAPRSVSAAPDFASVQGESLLYAGVRHARTLFYGPRCGAVLVVDELQSRNLHEYRQHFRFSQGLAAIVGPSLLRLVDDAAKSHALLSVQTQVLSRDQVQEVPCTLNGTVAAFAVNAADATFVTLLQTPAEDAQAAPRISGRTIVWEGERGRLTITLPIRSEKSYDWAPASGAP